jgi:hypothetical protein
MFDPRIKLGIAAAGALVPVHTYSTPDPDPSGSEGGAATVVTRGVTEWVADAERQVSFGTGNTTRVRAACRGCGTRCGPTWWWSTTKARTWASRAPACAQRG